jgi:regulator of sirC expression with transglutaminase-like and TPR domain
MRAARLADILRLVQDLRLLLTGRSTSVQLDVAALQLATIEFPGLDVQLFVQMLDSYAVEMAGFLAEGADGEDFVVGLNEYLFDELGFEGNELDYYDPRNSCLNEVLARRTGIPITLSIVYMEIARRLAKPVYGIGLPGHFLVAYDDGKFRCFIDPFSRGRLLTPEECRDLARVTAGVDISDHPEVLQPVGHRHILIRMLNNLRGVYHRQEAHEKAVQVLDLIIEAFPNSAEERRQRGMLNLELNRYKDAKADLEKYLKLAPGARDRALIEEHLAKIKRARSRLA